MFDSIPAYIMMGFRAVALIVVLIGLFQFWLQLGKSGSSNNNNSSNGSGHRLRQYGWQLSVIGVGYMLFVPVGFVGVRFVGNRYKKEAMFCAMELTRFALNIWLGLLAGWKKSCYRGIIDQSFMEKAEKFY
jgi:hypothetical protein